MVQLGADSQGRISYEQFLRRRLDLMPEIDALKSAKVLSDRESQGRIDSWEWDSGARDLSPVPPQQPKSEQSDVESSYPSDTVQRLLDEQAQRYDQQITELHSVIAELTRKLQQQRTMAIAEEDEASGNTFICLFIFKLSISLDLFVNDLIIQLFYVEMWVKQVQQMIQRAT